MTLIVHVDRGLDDQRPRAYTASVDRRKRLGFYAEQYAIGALPPKYPVPAIPLAVVWCMGPEFVKVYAEYPHQYQMSVFGE